jgi:hypothetical protein
MMSLRTTVPCPKPCQRPCAGASVRSNVAGRIGPFSGPHTVSAETPHVFICFSSSDEGIAREVVARLEKDGLNCWISLRDVPPGHNYQEAIINALEGAKGVVFLFSEFSSASAETKKELSVAASLHIPVFPLRLTQILPTGALRYELATRQWVDLFPDREQGFRRLIAAVRRVLDPALAAEIGRTEAKPTAMPVELRESAGSASTLSPVGAARAPIVAPGTQEFEAIRALLARSIGPIAKVYLMKAAAEARTPDDLCARLAEHVTSPMDRAAFLKEALSRLASKS